MYFIKIHYLNSDAEFGFLTLCVCVCVCCVWFLVPHMDHLECLGMDWWKSRLIPLGNTLDGRFSFELDEIHSFHISFNSAPIQNNSFSIQVSVFIYLEDCCWIPSKSSRLGSSAFKWFLTVPNFYYFALLGLFLKSKLYFVTTSSLPFLGQYLFKASPKINIIL